MSRDEVVTYFRRSPFIPFEVHFADGDRVVVRQLGEASVGRDFFSRPDPTNDGWSKETPLSQIVRIELLEPSTTSAG